MALKTFVVLEKKLFQINSVLLNIVPQGIQQKKQYNCYQH